MNPLNNDSPKQFGLFSVIRGVDADTAEIKSTEIIIETIMPKGVCGIIAGTTGANKSFLAMLFIWAFSSNTNIHKSTWAKALLIWLAIIIVIYGVIFGIFIGSMF